MSSRLLVWYYLRGTKQLTSHDCQKIKIVHDGNPPVKLFNETCFAQLDFEQIVSIESQII